MRALIAALIFTLAIAVTASVFAIWPVVADAPWETDVVVVDDRIESARRLREIRCEGALSYRNDIIISDDFRLVSRHLAEAEAEIDRYC